MKYLPGSLLLLLPIVLPADNVVPIESVESYVNIRSAPEAGSEIVGEQRKGEPLEYVGTEDGWHEVVVGEDLTGFVSADWSVVVATAAAAESEPAEAPKPAADVAEAGPQPAVAPEPAADAAAAEPGRSGAPQAEVEAPAADPVPDPAPEAAPAPGPVAVTGPPGPQGPPGPPGAATIEGDPGYLVRFKTPTAGVSSQIYDDGNRVGIGTDSPAQRLEVNGSIQINEQNSSVAGLMITQDGGETGYIMHNRASTLTVGAGSVDRLTIDRDGHVGIGVARPSHPLELANGAYVSAGGVWTNNSSRRDKDDIAALSAEAALAALVQLEPVQFSFRNEAGELYVGFIAEDVPELVASEDRQGLSAMDVVAVLTRVVQVQQQRIEELELRLDALE